MNAYSSKEDGLRQYLIDEFVEDYAEGRLTRREALQRLAGLVGMAAATGLLAACAPPAQPTIPPATATTAPTAPPPTTAPTAVPPTSAPSPTTAEATTPPTAAPTIAATQVPATAATTAPTGEIQAGDIQFISGADTIKGYLAHPAGDGPFPVVLVVHENRGLTEHIKDVTRRVAQAGYVGLAVDLLSRQGGTDVVGSANVPGVLGSTPPDQFINDLKAAIAYLKTQPYVRGDRIGITGFCFGGGVTWRAATQIPELRAAVPFYGPNPPLEDVPNIQAAVLAIYGERDSRINAGIPAIEAAMKQNNKTFEYIIYPNANHAFHNDTGSNYNAEAARDAWARTLAWFAKYLS